jgi:hypothetical protein
MNALSYNAEHSVYLAGLNTPDDYCADNHRAA